MRNPKGGTCFVSATLAMLAVVPGLERLHPSDDQPVIGLLAELGRADRGRKCTAHEASYLLGLVRMPSTDPTQQQSLGEFATRLLDALQREDGALAARFTYDISTNVHARASGYTSTTVDSGSATLTVSVNELAGQRTVDLQALFDARFGPEWVDDWREPGSAAPTPMVRTSSFMPAATSTVLVVEVSRQGNDGGKLLVEVAVPSVVRLSGATYRPIAAAYHYGTATSGHYAAVVRTGEEWTLYNDAAQTPYFGGLKAPTLGRREPGHVAAVLLLRVATVEPVSGAVAAAEPATRAVAEPAAPVAHAAAESAVAEPVGPEAAAPAAAGPDMDDDNEEIMYVAGLPTEEELARELRGGLLAVPAPKGVVQPAAVARRGKERAELLRLLLDDGQFVNRASMMDWLDHVLPPETHLNTFGDLDLFNVSRYAPRSVRIRRSLTRIGRPGQVTHEVLRTSRPSSRCAPTCRCATRP